MVKAPKAKSSMINIHPKRLHGEWDYGVALDQHTIRSEFRGYDEYNNRMYYTEYTKLGGLLHRLKYKGERAIVGEIADVAVKYLVDEQKKWPFDILAPVPPTKRRNFQAVLEMARGIRDGTERPMTLISVSGVDCRQLKGIDDPEERKAIMAGRKYRIVNPSRILGKRILLFDDLYDSGDTLNEITRKLRESGAKKVYVLTITKTKGKQ
jgi:predicted amidophosphoribosyltransferase